MTRVIGLRCKDVKVSHHCHYLIDCIFAQRTTNAIAEAICHFNEGLLRCCKDWVRFVTPEFAKLQQCTRWFRTFP